MGNLDTLDHRQAIASLTREQRSRLLARADLPGLFRLLLHWGAIVGVGALIYWRVPLWPALMVVQGILIAFLFCVLHETIHRTAFRSAAINKAVATVCGFLVFLPPVWFGYFHFAHHRHTQDRDRDPELTLPQPKTFSDYVWHLSSLPIWKSLLRKLWRNALGRGDDGFVPARAKPEVFREARVFIALYIGMTVASFAVGSAALLWLWIVPILLGQPFLRAFLLAEHTGCPYEPNMLTNTRTTFTNAAVKALTWNMPYHAEHHALPAAPFHKLPMLHALIQNRLQCTETGYADFHRKLIGRLR